MENKAKPRHIRRRRILRMQLDSLLGIGVDWGYRRHFRRYWRLLLCAAEPCSPRRPFGTSRLEVPLRIFSRDGYLISEIGERKRIPVTYEEIPEHVVQAFYRCGRSAFLRASWHRLPRDSCELLRYWRLISTGERIRWRRQHVDAATCARLLPDSRANA